MPWTADAGRWMDSQPRADARHRETPRERPKLTRAAETQMVSPRGSPRPILPAFATAHVDCKAANNLGSPESNGRQNIEHDITPAGGIRGFVSSGTLAPWTSALLAKASTSSPERVDGTLTNSLPVKVLILAAPDAALAPLCVSTSAYCATEPEKNQPQAGSVRHTLDTQQRWLFLNPFDAESSTFPSAPPRHSPPTTPPSIPPKSLPWGSIDHPTSTSHLMALWERTQFLPLAVSPSVPSGETCHGAAIPTLAKAPRNIPVLGADRGYNW